MGMETLIELEFSSLIIDATHTHFQAGSIKQNGAQAVDITEGSVLGYSPADDLWIPWVAGATDGSESNLGLWVGGTVTAAEIVAGDVAGNLLVGGNCRVREDMVTIETGDIDTPYDTNKKTLRHSLYKQGIFVKTTVYTTSA